jgi:hypothetical protein
MRKRAGTRPPIGFRKPISACCTAVSNPSVAQHPRRRQRTCPGRAEGCLHIQSCLGPISSERASGRAFVWLLGGTFVHCCSMSLTWAPSTVVTQRTPLLRSLENDGSCWTCVARRTCCDKTLPGTETSLR